MESDSFLRSYKYLAPELRLFHGEESLVALRHELERNGCQRAAVVCGRSMSLSGSMGLLHSALGPLLIGEAAMAREHSPVSSVEETAGLLKRMRADSVIAVGGGSAAVTARAAAILLAEDRPVQSLCTRRLEGGRFESPRLLAPKLPQFVIPTTPSTAFVKAGSAVHDPASGDRLALFDPKTRAKALFVHPEFVGTSPEKLVQGAALNTLATAIEALESSRCDPISEAMLIQTLRLIVRHLRPSPDLELVDRERLVLSAILCGRGTDHAGGGLATVLTHAIGPFSSVSNGIVNAIVLPHTMRFNAPCTQHALGAIVAGLWSASATDRSAAIPQREGALLAALTSRLKVPTRLRDIGVAQGSLSEIAEAAMRDWFISRNPRPVSDVNVVLSVLEAAW